MNPEGATHEARPTGNSGRGTAWVVGQGILLALISLSPVLIGDRPAWPDSLAGTTILLSIPAVIAGCLLIALSAVQLGSSFTIFPRPRDGGSLIQNGIYGRVRHPMYGGVLLIALGWSFFWLNIPALVLTLALGVLFDLKARREEGWLGQKYPECSAYRQHVRKLIPWIY